MVYDVFQSPRSVFSDLDAHIDMIGPQIGTFWRWWNIMNMAMKVDPAIVKGDDRAMRKNQVYLGFQYYLKWILDQSHAMCFTIGLTKAIMIALD